MDNSTKHGWGWARNDVLVGNSGVNNPEAPGEYLCTICAKTSAEGEPHVFQDLHVTREQAISIVKQLLKFIGE